MVADQNNAPERLKDLIYRVLRNYRQSEVADEEGDGYPLVDALTITGHSIDMGEREIANIADTLAYEIARADRAAPEGQVGALRDAHALTPPPAAPTDNTALVEAIPADGMSLEAMRLALQDTPAGRAMLSKGDVGLYWLNQGDVSAAILRAALASREAPPAAQEPVTDADLAAARAEIERLTKERDLSKELLRSCIQGNNVLRKKAQKAIAERDEARSMLADAERDMRQRAAEVCDLNDQVSGWVSRDAILALPLKHADREEGK